VAGAHQMPANVEQVANDTVDGEESLRLGHGLEAPHLRLALPRGLVRDFGSVVGVARGVVHDGRHDAAMCGPVAAEAIGDEAARDSAAALQQWAKEPRRGVAIQAGLQQDVDDVPVLIHCTPQILAPAVDSYEQLVQIPRVANGPAVTSEPPRVGEAEGLAPVPDGFVRDGDAALHEEVFRPNPSQSFEDHQFPRGRPRGRVFAWQTAWQLHDFDSEPQELVAARPSRLESPLPHHLITDDGIAGGSCDSRSAIRRELRDTDNPNPANFPVDFPRKSLTERCDFAGLRVPPLFRTRRATILARTTVFCGKGAGDVRFYVHQTNRDSKVSSFGKHLARTFPSSSRCFRPRCVGRSKWRRQEQRPRTAIARVVEHVQPRLGTVDFGLTDDEKALLLAAGRSGASRFILGRNLNDGPTDDYVSQLEGETERLRAKVTVDRLRWFRRWRKSV
jgi:hypothetical protein